MCGAYDYKNKLCMKKYKVDSLGIFGFDNQTSIMSGQDSILDGQAGATNPLMLEYMSQKYDKQQNLLENKFLYCLYI